MFWWAVRWLGCWCAPGLGGRRGWVVAAGEGVGRNWMGVGMTGGVGAQCPWIVGYGEKGVGEMGGDIPGVVWLTCLTQA